MLTAETFPSRSPYQAPVLHPLTKEKREWLRRAARDLTEDPPTDSSDTDPDPKVINLPTGRGANTDTQRSLGWKPILSLLLVSTVAAGLSMSSLNGPPRPERNPKQQVLRVKADEHGQFHVTIDINGTPIRALIDTGATNLMLAYQDAQQLRLSPSALDYSVRVMTANGESYAAPVSLAEVRLGKIQVQNVKCSTTSSFSALVRSVSGASCSDAARER